MNKKEKKKKTIYNVPVLSHSRWGQLECKKNSDWIEQSKIVSNLVQKATILTK